VVSRSLRPRVLIVDGNRLMCMSLQLLLEQEGCRVDTVPTVARARERLDRHRYRTVLADLFLSDGGGMEVARHARQRDPEVKVILLSDADDAVEPETAHPAGPPEIVVPTGDLAQVVRTTRRTITGPG